MKKLIISNLIVLLLLCLCGCSGNYSQVNLNEPVALPENGIVEKSVLEKIRNEDAIAVFQGVSQGINYEWTIFGSDITDTKDVNLSVDLSETDEGIKVSLSEAEDFGFPVLLSVHLNKKWNAQNATAYHDERAVYSVSVTGSKTSILNISVNKAVAEFIVIPDEIISAESTAAANDSRGNDSDDSGYEDNRLYSDGQDTGKDKYDTDPVPEGKPLPVEPENQVTNKKKTYTCTFSIECSTILNNLADLDPDKCELVPSDGVILAPVSVTFYEGESVFDVLQRVCKENNIHMEASWTPVYNSAYIEGINNLYEFDCGELSGWMYCVNGWYPNYGCSRYQLTDGEVVQWRYTCDLGNDVGREGMW